MSAELDRVRHVIPGIGIDVNQDAGEFPADLRKIATSLKIESGEAISHPALAVAILHELDEIYSRVCAGKFSQIADEWEEHCATIGKDVIVQIGDRKIRWPRRIAGRRRRARPAYRTWPPATHHRRRRHH